MFCQHTQNACQHRRMSRLEQKTDSRSFSEESFLYVYHQIDGHNTLTAFVAAEHLANHQKYP